MKNVNIRKIILLLFAICLGVGAVFYAWFSPSNMVCYRLEMPGIISEGDSSVPIARFDRVEIIATIGEDGKIKSPYHVFCEKKGRDNSTLIEEVVIYPCKKNMPLPRIYDSYAKTRKCVRKVMVMPDCLKGDGLVFKMKELVKGCCSIAVCAEFGYYYAYGHPRAEMHLSNNHMKYCRLQLDPQMRFRNCHGVILLQKKLDMEDIQKIKRETSQVEGDEYFCRTWFIGSDGSFKMFFFVRKLGILRNVLYGKIEGRFDIAKNIIMEKRVVYEPNDCDVDIILTCNDYKKYGNGFINFKFRYGMLTCYERLPVSKALKLLF